MLRATVIAVCASLCLVTLSAVSSTPPVASAQAEKAEKTAKAIGTEKKAISRYPVPTLGELPEDIATRFHAVQKKKGFMPNVLFALAHRPAEFRAFFAYAEALMAKASGLTPAEKEMMIVATSAENGCQYCVQSHGAALRLVTGNPYIADQVAINYRESDITPRQRAIIDFAMKVSNDSRAIDEADFAALRAHGLSDEDIWDAAAITAFFGMSNRMMNFAAVRPDDQYYSLGR